MSFSSTSSPRHRPTVGCDAQQVRQFSRQPKVIFHYPSYETMSTQIWWQHQLNYMEFYIDLLNDIIGKLRKVTSLSRERALLIKFVQKFRFYHTEYSGLAVGDREDMYYALEKWFEVLDVATFYITSALRNEVISKTLNTNLVLPIESCEKLNHAFEVFKDPDGEASVLLETFLDLQASI